MAPATIVGRPFRQTIYGALLGTLVVFVDNVAFEGEVSPIIIGAMLLMGTALVGTLWGWGGWYASGIAWICVPMAHMIKYLLGLPETLHPNTYASILRLAAFTLALSLIGTGVGVLLRKATPSSDNRSS
jgi:hypothetical protein